MLQHKKNNKNKENIMIDKQYCQQVKYKYNALELEVQEQLFFLNLFFHKIKLKANLYIFLPNLKENIACGSKRLILEPIKVIKYGENRYLFGKIRVWKSGLPYVATSCY